MLKYVGFSIGSAGRVVGYGEVDAIGGDGDVKELCAPAFASLAVFAAVEVAGRHGDGRAVVGMGDAGFGFAIIDVGEVGGGFAGGDKFKGGRLVENTLNISLAIRHLA